MLGLFQIGDRQRARILKLTFWAVGLMLVVSVALKFWLLTTDPFAGIRTAYPVWLLWAGVFVELGVLWILAFGQTDADRWWAVVPLLLLFFVLSLVRHVSGAEGCGCFGAVEIPPLLMSLVLLLFLVSLFVFGGEPAWVVGRLVRAPTLKRTGRPLFRPMQLSLFP